MRGNSGFVLPFFVVEQAVGILAVGVDMMRNTAWFRAGANAMLGAQGNYLVATGRKLGGDGSGDDDHRMRLAQHSDFANGHSFSVARVVLLDMK